ncbi:hypothetical protein OIU78_010061, partial [Salix suchowensis]
MAEQERERTTLHLLCALQPGSSSPSSTDQ